MATKCIMLFQAGDQDGGWSEVYNLTASNVQLAIAAMDALAAVRAQILSPDNRIIGYRITAPLAAPGPGFIRSQRTAYLASREIPGNGTLLGAASSDVVWTCVQLRLSDSTLTIFKNQLYRGVPDSFWSDGTDTGARAVMAAFVPTWLTALRLAGATIRHVNRGAAPSFEAINNVEYIRMTRRASGRAFGLLRGRK